MAAAVAAVTGHAPRAITGGGFETDGDPAALRALAHSHGWRLQTDPDGMPRLLPPPP